MGQRIDQSTSSHSSAQNMPQGKINPTRSIDKKAKPTGSQTPAQSASLGAATLSAQAKKGARVSTELRQRMIEEAAYYRAEKRGFCDGDAVQDWLDAEAEINANFPG